MSIVSAERAKNGYLLGKGEGEAHWLLGMLEIVKISGAETNGEFGLLEVTVRAGEGSPWHVHPDEDEWFYVLEGEFTIYVGERRLSLPAVWFAFGPKGVPHTFIAETERARVHVRPPAIPTPRASCARSAKPPPNGCSPRPSRARPTWGG